MKRTFLTDNLWSYILSDSLPFKVIFGSKNWSDKNASWSVAEILNWPCFQISENWREYSYFLFAEKVRVSISFDVSPHTLRYCHLGFVYWTYFLLIFAEQKPNLWSNGRVSILCSEQSETLAIRRRFCSTVKLYRILTLFRYFNVSG